MDRIKKFGFCLLLMLGFIITYCTSSTFVKAEASTIPINLRIESWDHTIVPYGQIQVKPYDLTSVVGDNKVGNWHKKNTQPLAIHAIVQGLQLQGYDVKQKSVIDVNSEGNYIASINNLGEFDKGPNSGWMYRVNDVVVGLGVGEQVLQPNDTVEMYFVGDYTTYKFGKIASSHQTVKTGENVTFTVTGQLADWKEVGSYLPVSGATIYQNGSSTSYVTGQDGTVSMKFNQPGTYQISAELRDETSYFNLIRPLPVTIVVEANVNPKPDVPKPETPNPKPGTVRTPTVQSIEDSSTTITGVTDEGATVTAKVDNETIGSAIATRGGAFTISIPKQKAGTTIAITAHVEGKANSDTVSIIVGNSDNPNQGESPTTLFVNPVTNLSRYITGVTEANVKVELIIEGKEYMTTTDEVGNFSFKIPELQEGTTAIVTVIATNGLKETKSVRVLDEIEPSITVDPINSRSDVVIGVTEADAQVELFLNNKQIGTTTAKQNGHFSIHMSRQKAGTILVVKATDKAGNESSKRISVNKADVYPVILNAVSDKTSSITGTAEANALIKLYINDSHRQTRQADQYGNFAFGIAKQKAGIDIKVQVINEDGKSIVKATTVIDRTPPKQPTVNKVTTASTILSGKAEASSTVYVYNGKTLIGKARVDSKGNFKTNIKKQKLGSKLSISAKDESGNLSKATLTKVYRK
ncbi:Ig-like domain-containing protein [Bacillus sp. JJ722]|uniref:Ig-like domain-containing protein n=1 Tax=Bacillus sp. JJ722 TaxID=3122973 RepID=UPI002FFE1480